jgi:hypothetical protein
MNHATLIGVDVHPALVACAVRNFGLPLPASADEYGAYTGKIEFYADTAKLKLLVGSVSDVAYDDLLAPYDVVIIHNKNSFNQKTTVATLESIRRACAGKTLFYFYNNPVFEEIFSDFPCVFQMKGWHKNWNAKIFKVATSPKFVTVQNSGDSKLAAGG